MVKINEDKLICGDAKVELESIENNSVDSLVTDPPYGISFMGKAWDSIESMEAFYIPIWKECLRVLKSGSFAFIMSLPRSDVLSKQIICLEKAGFRVDFSPIYWTFASGFPKAKNLSKAADKRGGNFLGNFGDIIKKRREELGISRTELANHFLSKTGGLTGCVWNWENGQNTPTLKQYNKLIDILGLSEGSTNFEKLSESLREVITTFPQTIGIGGNAKRMGSEKIISKPTSLPAKKLDGSYAGFQPKPAIENIIVAMKPLSENSYIDQALAWCENDNVGLGGTWLDDCRIPYSSIKDFEKTTDIGRGRKNKDNEMLYGINRNVPDNETIDGRFPANLLVSDNILDDGTIHKSSDLKTEYNLNKQKNKNGYQFIPRIENELLGDSGSFSRFFDLDFWFEERIKFLPSKVQKIFPFLKVPKASKSEKNKGLDKFSDRKTVGEQIDETRNTEMFTVKFHCKKCGKRVDYGCGCNAGWIKKKAGVKSTKNFHPTVKPIKLMSYLITLGSRENDIILDCFVGSGTTALAAKLLSRRFIAIEEDPEYFEIAKARLEFLSKQSRISEFFEKEKIET